MPKIIKDLRPHIKEEAMVLFEAVGYEKVSMRHLAKEVGIAVGTLYNYFSNKEDLYMEILIESWTATLEAVKANDHDLRRMIEIIYDGMIDRKGLGKVLLTFNHEQVLDPEPGSIEAIFAELIKAIEQVLIKDKVKYSEKKSRMMILNIATILKVYPKDREDNINYLLDIY